MSLNRVILTGRLTRDPEVRATQSGISVAKFTIAVNHYYKGEEKTSFIDLTAFGKNAELLRDYFKKGSAIGIDGTLHQESWESKEGEKRSKLVVYCERIDFIGSGKKNSDDSEPKNNQVSNKRKNDYQEHESDFGSESDLPF